MNDAISPFDRGRILSEMGQKGRYFWTEGSTTPGNGVDGIGAGVQGLDGSSGAEQRIPLRAAFEGTEIELGMPFE